jgi:hypothetical protein
MLFLFFNLWLNKLPTHTAWLSPSKLSYEWKIYRRFWFDKYNNRAPFKLFFACCVPILAGGFYAKYPFQYCKSFLIALSLPPLRIIIFSFYICFGDTYLASVLNNVFFVSTLIIFMYVCGLSASY